MRLTRAIKLIRSLSDDMTEWMLAGHVRAEYRSLPDRRTIEGILRLDSASPIEDFSFRLSEALHQFRGSFDGLAWELTHLGNVSPCKPKQVYFPMEWDATRWKDASIRLDSMPVNLLSRVEDVQPFNQSRPDLDVLATLARLSNSDKHQDLVSANLAPSFASNIGLRVDSDDHPDPDAPDIRFDFPEAPALVDGAVQIRAVAGRPVTYSTDSALTLSGLDWQVMDRPHGRLSLEHVIDALCLQLPMITNYVRNGGVVLSRLPVGEHQNGWSGTMRVFGVSDEDR